MTISYVDAVGAMKEWINSRTATLVGVGHPLQMGAHLKHLTGAASASYAYLTLLPNTYLPIGAEAPVVISRVSAQVYGPSLEAVTFASVALADEICDGLKGSPKSVTLASGAVVKLLVADDLTGPSDFPEGQYPRHLLDFNVVMTPGP